LNLYIKLANKTNKELENNEYVYIICEKKK